MARYIIRLADGEQIPLEDASMTHELFENRAFRDGGAYGEHRAYGAKGANPVPEQRSHHTQWSLDEHADVGNWAWVLRGVLLSTSRGDGVAGSACRTDAIAATASRGARLARTPRHTARNAGRRGRRPARRRRDRGLSREFVQELGAPRAALPARGHLCGHSTPRLRPGFPSARALDLGSM